MLAASSYTVDDFLRVFISFSDSPLVKKSLEKVIIGPVLTSGVAGYWVALARDAVEWN